MLDERTLSLFAAAAADAIGHGGVSRLSRITGLARLTVVRGQQEFSVPAGVSSGRVRRPGAGRKRSCDCDPTLVRDLERLVGPLSRGDPMSPLRWISKSIRTLASALVEMGHAASHRLVWATLRELKYSLQGNRKMEEGNQHPDRNAQFEHINTQVALEMRYGNPVISVDTNWTPDFLSPVQENPVRSRLLVTARGPHVLPGQQGRVVSPWKWGRRDPRPVMKR